MYSDRKTKKTGWLWLCAAALALVLIAGLLLGAAGGPELRESGAAAIRAAVERGARQCYAVEGVYPPDLRYLCDNYGLQINTEDYYISYEIYASNVAPTVKVAAK